MVQIRTRKVAFNLNRNWRLYSSAVFGMKYCSNIRFLYTNGLLWHQISQEYWKRPKRSWRPNQRPDKEIPFNFFLFKYNQMELIWKCRSQIWLSYHKKGQMKCRKYKYGWSFGYWEFYNPKMLSEVGDHIKNKID